MKRILEITIILSIAVSVGLMRNQLHAKGLPVKGQWDRSEGAVSAWSKEALANNEVIAEIKAPSEAKALFDSGGYVFVDARGEEAYKENHVKGAVSLPVDEFQKLGKTFIDKYPTNSRLIIYCSGRECEDSHTLGGFLKDLGYKEIKIMIDGLPGWQEGGFPIERN